MSTPSEKFDYAVHLGNVLLKDDFAGAPLCAAGDEGVVRGAIRTVIDLAVTAARAADAKEIEHCKRLAASAASIAQENARLKQGLLAAEHLLLAAKGPIGGPTSWTNTYAEWRKMFAQTEYAPERP